MPKFRGSLGIVLVALAAASAYGLDRKDDVGHAIAYVVAGGSTRDAETRDVEAGQVSPARPVQAVTDELQANDVPIAASGPVVSAVPSPASDNIRGPTQTGGAAETPLYVPPIVMPNPAISEGLPPEPSTSSGVAGSIPASVATAPSAPVTVAPVTVASVPTTATASVPLAQAAPAITPVVAAPALPPSTPAAIDGAAQQPASTGPADPRLAKVAFGAVKTAAPMAARAIGFYSRGCLAGAKMLPVDGPTWQAMRLSRNRNWGHPDLIRFVEKLSSDARTHAGWPGLLVGDLSQPRGGPSPSDHASHQIGLDADIWLSPMPDRRLTPKEREDLSSTDMLGAYKLTVDPAVWTPNHVHLIKRTASYREVERVLVHPAIKKALCDAAGTDREWLKKVRPIWGHNTHFHIRIACPAGSPTCSAQSPPPNDDGCGKEIDDWFALLSRPVKPAPPPDPNAPAPAHPRGLRIDQLPAECRMVLDGKEPFYKRFFRSPAAAKTADKAADKAATKAAAASAGAERAAAK
jgi:penicillin-insensitive murein DD-endopeptidase